MGARGPKATTGEKINLRVAQGSALERLLQGRGVTETIHRMAELIEAGPPSVVAELPIRMMDRAIEIADRQRWERQALAQAQRDALTPEAPGPVAHNGDPEPAMVMIGHGRDQKLVSREEALALAAEQTPGGLVPVGLDMGDQFDNDEVVEPEQATDTGEHNDLSHLI